MDLFAVSQAVPVAVVVERVGAVNIDLITVVQPVIVTVRVVGVGTEIMLLLIGQPVVVRINRLPRFLDVDRAAHRLVVAVAEVAVTAHHVEGPAEAVPGF